MVKKTFPKDFKRALYACALLLVVACCCSWTFSIFAWIKFGAIMLSPALIFLCRWNIFGHRPINLFSFISFSLAIQIILWNCFGEFIGGDVLDILWITPIIVAWLYCRIVQNYPYSDILCAVIFWGYLFSIPLILGKLSNLYIN